jgi:hypothetical protein
MTAVEVRRQRLRELERIIVEGMETFVAVGFALKEIRDDELYREAGLETWDRYLKERVKVEFGIERTQALQLIACAQIRVKLPDISGTSSGTADEGQKWSQNAVYEFARLAPKDEGTSQGYDFDRLDRRDVQRVAKKVIDHCEKEEVKPTSTIVRKYVDEELGIDRSAKGQATRQQREEESRPHLLQYVVDLTGTIEARTEKLATVDEDGWKHFRASNPTMLGHLRAACSALMALLKRIDQ